jgi:hypothetical protein
MTIKQFAGYLIAAVTVLGFGLGACGGKNKAPATAQDKAAADMKKADGGGTTYGAGSATATPSPATPSGGN